ncbi:MAG: tetratricopeptide repeat protein, partial [Bacteroidota bacterium]
MIRSIFFALGMASVALGWCAGVVMAQTEPADPVDSLRTALGLAETDAERARLHVELARYYSGIQDGDRLAVHAQAGLRFAKREQIDSLSADAYELLGLLAYEEGEYDRALAMSDSAMALNEAASDPLGMAAAFNLRGVVFLERGACDESVAAYGAALARIDESDAPRYVETMLNLTRANATCGQFEIAIQGAERVIPIAQANGLQKAQGSLIDVVAYSYSVLGRHEEALQAYEGYEALLDDVGLPLFESAFYNNRALVYEAMGEYERAYAGYQKSHEIDVRAGQTRTLPESLLNLGSAAAGLGRHTEAIDYLEEAIETFEAREQILDLPDSYDRLAVSYAAVGQQQKAYASLRRAYVLRDSVLGREAQEAMAEMNARFETERIQRDLAETRLDAQAA